MEGTIGDLGRAVLRERGPLTAEELAAEIAARRPGPPPKKGTIQTTLRYDRFCAPTGDGRFVYLPTFIRGARVRLPMAGASPGRKRLVASREAVVLLWIHAGYGTNAPAPVLELDGGPAVEVRMEADAGATVPGALAILSRFGDAELEEPLWLPEGFWNWWKGQQRSRADSLVLRCEDGDTGRFACTAVRAADLDAARVGAANESLHVAALQALKRRRDGLDLTDFIIALIARGVYHQDPPPDPLKDVLLTPQSPIMLDVPRVVYRPDIPLPLRALAAQRGQEDRWDRLLRGPDFEPPRRRRAKRPPAAQSLYQFKVSFGPEVWRRIELLDNETLHDLHNAIQTAFGWDNDHLYSFYMSGRRWDRLTEIAGTPLGGGDSSPSADEVMLAELGLQVGQRFLYLFDYGDELRHEVLLERVSPPPASDDFPRVVESHGEAPPQYPDWDEEEDEDELEIQVAGEAEDENLGESERG